MRIGLEEPGSQYDDQKSVDGGGESRILRLKLEQLSLLSSIVPDLIHRALQGCVVVVHLSRH